jgi:hypothetical protein
VLAGTASYQDAFNHDHCLKPMMKWDEARKFGYIKPVEYDGYSYLAAGEERQVSSGQHNRDISMPSNMWAIRAAIQDCSALERKMRNAWPDNWYSPHILVRCNGVKEAQHLCDHTNRYLDGVRDTLIGEGWEASVIVSDPDDEHSGRGKSDRKEDNSLFHRDPGIVHSFMLAKTLQSGRCVPASKRILFVVDMAVRGMNNWPILFIVDIACGGAKNIQVQLKGRDLRLPKDLFGKLVKDTHFNDFCMGRYYYPKDANKKLTSTEWAFDFILDMEENAATHCMHWRDLLRGKDPSKLPEVADTEDSFTRLDQLHIEAGLSAIRSTKSSITQISKDDIERTVLSLPKIKGPQGSRARQARQYASDIVGKPEFRAKLISTNLLPEDIIQPIAQQEPKKEDDYTDPELLAFILNSPDYDSDRNEVKDCILSGNSILRKQVAKNKRKYDAQLFVRVPRLMRLRNSPDGIGILDEIKGRLQGDLISSKQITPRQLGRVAQAVAAATCLAVGKSGKWEFEKDYTANDGPLDHPSYHLEFNTPQSKALIMNLALKLLRQRREVISSNLFY